MFSSGEVCVVTQSPITDIDAVRLAEIDTGSILLNLDDPLLRKRQNFNSLSHPSPCGFGYPPHSDMYGLTFYSEPPAATVPQLQGDFGQMEIDENEMARLLIREMIPDILADCHKLNLHPNLYTWSVDDVRKWIACVVNRYELGEVNLSNFYINGMMLSALQDAEFRERAPKCGDILFSIVYILKSGLHIEHHAPQVVAQAPMVQVPPPHEVMPIQPPSPVPSPDGGSTDSTSDDEYSIPSPPPSGPNTSMTPNHTGGIQLWQFLKELLLQPNSYMYCIRWLDQSQGIFKIEDSVEVARLWGLRKNRPAMNYDKLSRSIRQYYRKGIMKKTEVSQRLVYQFVHPF